MMNLEKFTMRMYGDYECSCGCGKQLGYNSVILVDESYCICVGEECDDEGYRWRSFTKQCWDKLNLDSKSLEYIYETYPAAPYIENTTDDYSENMCCDTTGLCNGTNCPRYFACQV